MRALVVTDLDGTLLRPDHAYHASDLETLRRLGDLGVVRCIATGRNLYSLRQVVPETMPIDYVVFSSGAGTVSWPGSALLDQHAMSAAQVDTAFGVLRGLRLDFMIHDPVPENHAFVCYAASCSLGPDYLRRIERYGSFARIGDPLTFRPAAASQLLAVVEGGIAGEQAFRAVKHALADLSVVRSTSPLDGRSVWIEVFSPLVSKSQAAARVALRHGVSSGDALAVGNDYNDEDLLAWAGSAFVVPGAPAELRARFAEIRCSDGAVLTSAVREWTKEQGRRKWK